MDTKPASNMIYKVRESSWIARFAAWKLGVKQVAIVIGDTIHLHNTGKEEFLRNRRWLKHELKHIEQFRKHGFVPFVCKYLWESFRVGYYNNKFEKEARDAEHD
jgi:hypothetical protein